MSKTLTTCQTVLRKLLLDPCDHKRRSHEEVGCVVHDATQAVNQAEEDAKTIKELTVMLKSLAALVTDVRDEQTSSVMGFGQTQLEKRQRAEFYARNIREASGKIEEILPEVAKLLLKAEAV